jgi:hypothetical protein
MRKIKMSGLAGSGIDNFFDASAVQGGGDIGFLKKALKKVEKGVRTAVKSTAGRMRKISSPIAKKTLPSKVREVGRDLDKKGITKIAAGIALSFVNPGAGGMLVKAAIGQAAKAAVASGAKDYATVKAQEAGLRQSAQIAAELGAAQKELPYFQDVVAQLRGEGYTDAEILAHWVESKSYYQQASEMAAQSVQPIVHQAIVDAGSSGRLGPEFTGAIAQQGVNAPIVQAVAHQMSEEIGEKAAADVQKKAAGGGGVPWLLGAGIILSILTGV